jgi:glycosyltransferase involved in cell wall biosynthesis
MKPLISVIIPAYNASDFISQAIESVLSQSYEPLEIIAIDNGSNDHTSEVIRSYSEKVKCIRLDPNKGVTGARNVGIQSSRGELIAFLDADDQWLPGKIEQQQAILDSEPDIGLVHTDVFYWNPDAGDKNIRECGREQFTGNCYTRFFFDNHVMPSSVLLRRECLEAVGLFDEGFYVAEDWDLWFRIARRFRFAYLNYPMVLYRVHEGSLSNDHARMRQHELLVIKKALANDPNLKSLIGSNQVQRALHELNFSVGYSKFQSNELKTARKFFADAIAAAPIRIKPITYYMACLLPTAFLFYVRKLKKFSIEPYEFKETSSVNLASSAKSNLSPPKSSRP